MNTEVHCLFNRKELPNSLRAAPSNSEHFPGLFGMPSTHHLLPRKSNKCLISLARANGWRCPAWPAHPILRFDFNCDPLITISKETLTRGDFMKKLHAAKMNRVNSISLAANFDAAISRHWQELYPQTDGNLTFSKSPPSAPALRRRRISLHRPGQRRHETQIRSAAGPPVESIKRKSLRKPGVKSRLSI